MSIREIAPGEVAALASKGAIDIVDVRTPAEYAEAHVRGARNVPLDRLDPAALQSERGDRAHEPLYLVCKAGSRSKQACEQFFRCGFEEVAAIAGGTEAWAAAGLPVERSGRKAIALDRQMRIAAGTLVVVGAVLGYVVHPAWIGLSAFVGAGLVFAGITDICPMSNLIARMPWNR